MAEQIITVEKRDGRREPIDYEKINRVVLWAKENLTDVSASEVILKAKLNFYDGMPTTMIHEALTRSAANLISESSPDYQILAARLAIFHIRKNVYGDFEPIHLFEQVKRVIGLGLYDPELLNMYTEDEFNIMNGMLDHSRDLNFAYAAIKQLEGKYLVQNRATQELHESPQMLYILVAACLFSSYPKETRLSYVRRFYEATSLFKISLPTPIMSGVRTATRQFSSCVVIEGGDNLDAINAATSAITKYASQRAGIGINLGMLRGQGMPIRNGEAYHTGSIPFFKYAQAAVKSCSQGGVRGASATLFYPLWHIDVESFLVLKNNRGVEENRVRHLDYGVQINGFLYKRLIKNEKISLFSPGKNECPGLYDAFFEDQEEFARLYTLYENDPSIPRKTVNAMDLFPLLGQERASTGRKYIQHVDHCNTHSSFIPRKAPIRMSNLCMEITLPTKPLEYDRDPDGEISLCTLIAFNLGQIESLDDFEELSDLAVRAIDALIDHQDYPVVAARNATLARRSIGTGLINYAYYLAKNGVKYSDGSANELTHQTVEAMQYYLIKASVNLAKEFGPCSKFSDTKYSEGILPIDTYNRNVDKICSTPLRYDWEALRQEILTHGMRNSTLTAFMPSETSSQISNATNGVEPPRGFVSVKSSKEGILKQVVPDLRLLRAQYELLWDLPGNKGKLDLMAIMQKFVDQSISTNCDYDPLKFPEGKVPMKTILKDMMYAYQMGIKTLYYHNTRDGASDAQGSLEHALLDVPPAEEVLASEDDDGCAGGACRI